MKISSKLEEMVADLVSDEKQKREEVEAVLSQIHSLTEAYFSPATVSDQTWPEGSPERRAIERSRDRTPVTVDKELESQRKMFEAKGFPTEEAERRAKGILGID